LDTGSVFIGYRFCVHWIHFLCALDPGSVCIGYRFCVHWIQVLCALDTGSVCIGYGFCVHWIQVLCTLYLSDMTSEFCIIAVFVIAQAAFNLFRSCRTSSSIMIFLFLTRFLIFNPFQFNFSASRILPSSHLFWAGKSGVLLVIILQF
jgi:hypothetical protein